MVTHRFDVSYDCDFGVDGVTRMCKAHKNVYPLALGLCQSFLKCVSLHLLLFFSFGIDYMRVYV